MRTTALITTLALACTVALAVPAGAQAAGFGDLLKQFGAFDFGGNEFDPSDMQGNKRSWEDRERWVKEALDNAYLALARADDEISLFDFQNYIGALNIDWTPEYLQDPNNIGNLNAYATFTEYLSRYLRVKQELIESIAALNRNYAILHRVDPKKLTGPFQLEATGQTKTLTERAAGGVDATAADMALATSAGAVEKFTAELNRAIDYGMELETFFRRAANIQ
ncbi:hypothetical protein [Thiohalocapsa sp. ML1]|jgi:hypothetical protein|uniref:hypothetical protein n=1 Tax=Thiohalocapsa sp. ML1 TaxID=1431688 RepID=UPI0009E7D6B0|nr:hypothetical protein [Thiohalocapsa sp. ML1]